MRIWNKTWAHPTPPATAPPKAPAPRSPSLELKKTIAAPIMIAIIRTVSHIVYHLCQPIPRSQRLIIKAWELSTYYLIVALDCLAE